MIYLSLKVMFSVHLATDIHLRTLQAILHRHIENASLKRVSFLLMYMVVIQIVVFSLC